jgi:hypothetical protein
MDATSDLNETVYEQIGLTERQRNQLIELLALLRASGNEFDVARSEEVIDELSARAAPGGGRSGRKGRRPEVA